MRAICLPVLYVLCCVPQWHMCVCLCEVVFNSVLTDCWVNVIDVFDLPSRFVCVVSLSGVCECICVR